MKSAQIPKYGPPEVIVVKDIPTPTLEDNEMLVKVHASSVNTIDTTTRSGKTPFFGLLRLSMGIRGPKSKGTGLDVAGEIVEVGKGITKFKIGDQIFGFGACVGACAEYVKASERGVVKKPASLSYTEAAAVPLAALTALQFLRDLGNIQDGQDILIYGASGGVGTFAVQYANFFNVNVTAVCSGKNTKLVRELGADRVIDYEVDDFTKLEDKYDIIFDTVGKSPQRRWKKALKDNGVFLQAGSPKMSLFMLLLRMLGNKFRKKKIKMLVTTPNASDLTVLSQLFEQGKMKVVIDRTFTLDDIVEAHRYYDKGHSAGKVVIRVDHNLS